MKSASATSMDGRPKRHFRAAFLCGLLLAVVAEVAASQEPVLDPPGRAARLSLIRGDVTLAPAGTEDYAEAVLNRPLTSGDQLYTEEDARTEVQVGNATVHLDENTAFSFIELDDDVMQMSVTEGVATVRVRRRAEREVIQIETPNATVSLLHAGEYTVEVDPRVDQTLVRTRTGESEVLAGDDAHVVRAGEEARFAGLDSVQVATSRLGGRSEFENWANDRERDLAQAESDRYVSRDVVGYEDLDDHGDWVHEPEYGHVWRPRHVAHDWAPYRFGRWAWISPWGWTWIDDARWGYAPFHYGRWAHVRDRWCWVPGPRHVRPVYSPAFVAWTGRPGSGVALSISSGVGWYPLGPREIYVPAYRHSPRYIRHVNHSNTIIINNLYLTNAWSGRHSRHDYRYRHHPHAVTVVDRDHFVRGHPLGNVRLRLDDRNLREWRSDPRPPAIAPERTSVIAGRIRDRMRDEHRQRTPAYRQPGRIGFDDERRLAETTGRPPGRAELFRGDPKDGAADFRRMNPALRDAKRPERAFNREREYARAENPAVLRTDPEIRSPNRWRERQTLDTADSRRSWREAQRAPIQSMPAIENNGGWNTRERVEPRISQPRSVEPRVRPPDNNSRWNERGRANDGGSPRVIQSAPPPDNTRYAPRDNRIDSSPRSGGPRRLER